MSSIAALILPFPPPPPPPPSASPSLSLSLSDQKLTYNALQCLYINIFIRIYIQSFEFQTKAIKLKLQTNVFSVGILVEQIFDEI